MKDYEKSITVKKPAGEVYAALTQHIPDWWSTNYSGAAAQKGDQYNIAFGETRKTFEIIEAIPGQQVTWLCIKAYIDVPGLTKRDEWAGTKLIWTITSDGKSTTVTLNHEGLNKSFECYDVCEPAWDYFTESLQAYLTTGKGTPYVKAEVSV